MCFFPGPGAHLDQQKAPARRQQRNVVDGEILAAHEFNQQGVESFQTDRSVFQHARHRVRGQERIGKRKRRQHAKRRARGEIQGGRHNRGAGAFAPYQRAGHVKAVLGQQFVEVVARNAARNARKFFPDEVGITIAQAGESGIDLSHAPAAANERIELSGTSAPHRHARAVVEHDVERLYVVGHLAAQQAVHAATVVADHAAQGASRVRRGIGRIGEVVHLCGFAQAIENDARFNRGQPGFRIDRAQPVHVFRKIEDHGHVRALAGQARPRAARQHRGPGGAAGCQRRFHVRGIAGQNHSDRKLAIVRRIGRVHGAKAHVEMDFAAQGGLEPRFEFPMRRKTLVLQRRLAGENRKSGHAGMVTPKPQRDVSAARTVRSITQ